MANNPCNVSVDNEKDTIELFNRFSSLNRLFPRNKKRRLLLKRIGILLGWAIDVDHYKYSYWWLLCSPSVSPICHLIKNMIMENSNQIVKNMIIKL